MNWLTSRNVASLAGYGPCSRQSLWLDSLAARGKMLTLSIVAQLAVFFQDLGGSLDINGPVKTWDVQTLAYLLCFSEMIVSQQSGTIHMQYRQLLLAGLSVSAEEHIDQVDYSIDWQRKLSVSLPIPWYTQSLVAFPIQLWGDCCQHVKSENRKIYCLGGNFCI